MKSKVKGENKMKMSKPKNIDSYIANSGREARPKLKEMLKFRVQI
jgi:hypothetical protein